MELRSLVGLLDVVTDDELEKLNTQRVTFVKSDVYIGRKKITKTISYRVEDRKEIFIMYMVHLHENDITAEINLHMMIDGNFYSRLDKILFLDYQEEINVFQAFFEKKREEIIQQANELLSSSNNHRLLTLFNEAINVHTNIATLNQEIQQYTKNPNKEIIRKNYLKMFGEAIKDFV